MTGRKEILICWSYVYYDIEAGGFSTTFLFMESRHLFLFCLSVQRKHYRRDKIIPVHTHIIDPIEAWNGIFADPDPGAAEQDAHQEQKYILQKCCKNIQCPI